ncbi:hypothetical protein EBB06_10960 [Crenobacter cavernae]|uniref:ESPR domain-containing protein n=1 Tax=Crenobacter cavernae TaxID=2290923 RepID=A0ABY0FAZ9_9NEIS|nr:hypothetical protein EBB06_10960 [Crenobacter cavernae]
MAKRGASMMVVRGAARPPMLDRQEWRVMNWMTALAAAWGMFSHAGGAVAKPPETPVVSRPVPIYRTRTNIRVRRKK